MKTVSICIAAIVVAPLIGTHTDAHGIAGNRYFDGTLGFDDPAVAMKLSCRTTPTVLFPLRAVTPLKIALTGRLPDC